MKATLFISSLFFLLGLKISNLIDLPGKANAVDQIIINKIVNSKPVKAIPLFKDAEQETTVKEDKGQADQAQTDNESPGNTDDNL